MADPQAPAAAPPQAAASPDDAYWAQFEEKPAPKGAPARAGATPIETISSKEANLRQASGGYLKNGKPAPQAAMVDTTTGPAPSSAAGPADDEGYWKQFGEPEPGPAPPPAPPPPPKTLSDRLATLGKGAAGFGLDTAQFLNMAGATGPMLVDKVHSLATGIEQTGAQDTYFKHFIDPIVAGKQQTDLPPDADFTDKLLHGIGATAAMIGSAIATGGEAPAGAAATVMGRAATGAAQMTAPAAIMAIDTGKRVYEATGDAKAAAIAGSASYTTNALMGAVPMAVGAGIPTRMATGAAIGPVLGEASRQIQNLGSPESMQQPFNKEDSLVQMVTGSMFGLLPHAGGEAPRVEERPETIMDHAQTAAATAAKAAGGDNLDAVVAATDANAHVGAHYDAAAYEAHMARNEQLAAEARLQGEQPGEGMALETPEQEAKRVPAAGFEAGKPAEGAPPETLFARREQEQAAAKEADYNKALQQKGGQEAEGAMSIAEANAKGEEGAQKPTLGDTLKPEERQAFESLKERRAAEATQAASPETGQLAPEDRFMPYTEPKAAMRKLTAEEEEGKPPGVVGKLLPAQQEAAEFSPSPETEPLVSGPAKTLAERREAAQEAARPGNPETEPLFNEPPAKAPETLQERRGETPPPKPAEKAAAEPEPAVEAAAPVQPREPETGQFRAQTLAERRAQRQFVRQQKESADFAGGRARTLNLEDQGRGTTAKAIFGAKAKPKMTAQDVRTAIKPVTDKVGTDRIQVHDDHTTIPPHLTAQAAARGFPPQNIRGVYDRSTGIAHVIASAHDTPESAVRNVVHEVIGHQGIQGMLPDWRATMRDVHANLRDEPLPEGFRDPRPGSTTPPANPKAWIKEYMDQHGFDPRNPRHQATAAGEYVAHLAERDIGDPAQEHPTILRRAIDALRTGLRKVGIVHDWTNDDLRALLRKSANNLESEHARAAAAYKGDGADFSMKDDDEDALSDNNPVKQGRKFGRAMEEQANYNPGFIRSARDFVGNTWDKTVDARLGAIGLRNLPDFMNPKLMPGLRSWIRTHDQMDGRRGQLMEDARNKVVDWDKWASANKDKAKDLGDLMHGGTLAGVDVAKPFEMKYSDEDKAADPTKQAHEDMRKNYYDHAKKVWNGLDDKGRELYQTVRDHYAQQREDVYKALTDRINTSDADDQSKKQTIALLRQKFEAGRVDAPYFPLMRYGDHWASAKDKDGNVVSFSRFESKTQKAQWLREMQGNGFKTDGGERLDDKSMMERIDPKFVQKIMGLKGLTTDLKDDIWQEYLKAMPEMSMRKQFIHRQGRLGYTMDAMRNFSYSSFHGAHQLARLEYGNRLDMGLDDIKTQANQVNSDAAANPGDSLLQKNATYAAGLAREMARRYDWIKNPRAGALASWLTKQGFKWYLGAAPATAFRISSQNMMLASPMLAKYHGQIGATRELSRAVGQWALSKGDLGDTLRGDERRAFDTAKDMGVFSSTATQMLASGGAGGQIDGTVQKALAYMFNGMEHKNRMTTYLAAYRLGRTSGMAHDAAVEHATDLTWDSHFDYSNANRPRWLQNDFAKVAGLFKQYSWGVTYRLAREGRDMIDGELSGEQRTQARKAFGGLLAKSAMFSGATGLPFSWLAYSAINAVMGDKDRPFDSEEAMHGALADHLGQTAADAITTGPMGAITGASLSGGASYSDLWYRPPQRNESMQDTIKDAAMQALGAVPAIGINMAQGADLINQGDTWKGVEHFLPPTLQAASKSVRYSQQGVTNMKGEQILAPEELDARDKFLQAVGFTPQKVADIYAANAAIKNVEKAVTDRREKIINGLAMTASMGDEDGINNWMDQMEHFNDTNPGMYIPGKTIVSSMRNQFKNQMQDTNGVRVPPGLEDLRSTYK